MNVVARFSYVNTLPNSIEMDDFSTEKKTDQVAKNYFSKVQEFFVSIPKVIKAEILDPKRLCENLKSWFGVVEIKENIAKAQSAIEAGSWFSLCEATGQITVRGFKYFSSLLGLLGVVGVALRSLQLHGIGSYLANLSFVGGNIIGTALSSVSIFVEAKTGYGLSCERQLLQNRFLRTLYKETAPEQIAKLFAFFDRPLLPENALKLDKALRGGCNADTLRETLIDSEMSRLYTESGWKLIKRAREHFVNALKSNDAVCIEKARDFVLESVEKAALLIERERTKHLVCVAAASILLASFAISIALPEAVALFWAVYLTGLALGLIFSSPIMDEPIENVLIAKDKLFEKYWESQERNVPLRSFG